MVQLGGEMALETRAEPPVARLEGASAGYGKGPDVLSDIRFIAEPNAVAAIAGPSGAGKSALLEVLRLDLPLRTGAGQVLESDIARLSAGKRAKLKRRIGVLRQNPVLIDHLDAAANVALGLRLSGAKPRDYAEDVEEVLAFVGLSDRDDRPASVLSGSERRRVAVARAVLARPLLVLADEPTAGLSPDLAGRVMRLIVSMRRAGAAVVVATQDEALALSLPGAHWRLQAGRLGSLKPIMAEARA